MKNTVEKRFLEIDFFRGIAILMMIFFHLVFDLDYFGFYNFGIDSSFWWFFSRTTASIFIILFGISLTLSYSRNLQKKEKNLFAKYLRRGIVIFSLGLFITVVTSLFLGKGFIIFGILHFIGISIILAYFLVRYKFVNLFLGISIILIGVFLDKLTFDFSWLIWLGFAPSGFYTFDYFPIFPWFGLVLIGIFLGNILYKDYKRNFNFPLLFNCTYLKPFSFLGRHSLLIYFVHQPVLIIILYSFGI